MNILIIPEYFNGRDLRGISQIASFEDMIRGWPVDDHFFVFIGKSSKGYFWGPETLALNTGRTTMIELDVPGDGINRGERLSDKTVSTEELDFLLNINTSSFYPIIDVVLNRRREAARIIEYAVNYKTGRSIPVMSIIGDAKIAVKGKTHIESSFATVLEQLVVSEYPCLFQSAADREFMVADAGKALSASRRRNISKSPVIRFPMDWGALPLDDIRLARAKSYSGIPRFGYFGSLWRSKRVPEMVEILEGLRRFVPGLELIVTTQASKSDRLFKKPWIEFHNKMTRLKYYSYLYKADIVLMTSAHETTGRAYWEQLISGIDLMFLDAYWIREFIGDFPFVAKNLNELSIMTLSILRNKKTMKRFKKANADLRVRISDMLDHKKVAGNIQSLVQNTLPVVKPVKFLNELIHKMKPTIDKLAITGAVSIEAVDVKSKLFTKNGKCIITQNHLVSARQVADCLVKAGYTIMIPSK